MPVIPFFDKAHADADMDAVPSILGGRRLTIAKALSTEWPEPDYVFGPLQPGDVGQIAGADGSGKSWLGLIAGLTIATGRSVCNVFDAPKHSGHVLYFCGEDRLADHGRRLARLARHVADHDGIQISEDDDRLSLVALEGKRVPLLRQPDFAERSQGIAAVQDASAFKQAIAGYRAVFLDPLRMFHDLNESDGTAMDQLVRMLVQIAIENNQVIIVIHHASQAAILDSRSDHHAGRGATDFVAGCRGVWTLRGLSKSERAGQNINPNEWKVLSNSKSSHRAESGQILLRRNEGGVLRRDDLAEASKPIKKERLPKKKNEMNPYLAKKFGEYDPDATDY